MSDKPVSIKLSGMSIFFLVLTIPLLFVMMIGFITFIIAAAPVVLIAVGVCMGIVKIIDWFQ